MFFFCGHEIYKFGFARMAANKRLEVQCGTGTDSGFGIDGHISMGYRSSVPPKLRIMPNIL